MSECSTPTMRDLLPEYLHHRLEPTARLAVDAHLVDCDECRLELAMLTSVRQAMQQRTPLIDTAAIVRVLPRPPRKRTVRPFMMQLAAAISFISIGGVSLVVARSFYDQRTGTVIEDTARRSARLDSVPKSGTPVTAAGRAGLTVGGGVADLGADQLEQLLGALESLEAVPSAEPDDLLSQELTRASGVR